MSTPSSSPKSPWSATVTRSDLYQRAGVKEYWIIDPVGHWVQQYLQGDDGLYAPEVTFESKGTLVCRTLSGFTVDIATLWPVFRAPRP